VYVDGTFGRGGHTAAILERLIQSGRVVAMDKDPEAVAYGKKRFGTDKRFSIEWGSFALLQQLTDRLGLTGQVDGLILDLGMSSPQLDESNRGFSFMHDGPLDMRMDSEHGQTAAEWINNASYAEIIAALKTFGEERHARRIGKMIVSERNRHPITSTLQLADLISMVVPRREKKKHPATRTFQAIRILINHELEDLSAVLRQCLVVLRAGGRLVVISFHSLEDRIVKRFIRQHCRGPQAPRRLPIRGEQSPGELRAINGKVRASELECHQNPRARSAIMRVAERLA
jgi:16S rRNA (cytosine1402-N4)-methyltransferase